MNEPKTIKIDDVEYVRADSIEEAADQIFKCTKKATKSLRDVPNANR